MEQAQDPKHAGHEMVETIIYGPVFSRRYGNSLGINLLPPDKKVCSFNCVYCQLGCKEQRPQNHPNTFPSFDSVVTELRKKLPALLSKDSTINSIAVSGNGEPTLHPHFAKIVPILLSLVKKAVHPVSVVCFTNGSALTDAVVASALTLFDECCVKWDADCRLADRPKRGFDPQAVLSAMKTMNNLVVQSCFFDGALSNSQPQQIGAWLKDVVQLDPLRVDLYTISRKAPINGLCPVESSVLKKIALQIAGFWSGPVRVF